MSKTLEQRTLTYWKLSRKWNGRSPKAPKIKVQTALVQLKSIHGVTHYTRALSNCSASLAEQMIIGGQTKKPEKDINTSKPVGTLEGNQK